MQRCVMEVEQGPTSSAIVSSVELAMKMAMSLLLWREDGFCHSITFMAPFVVNLLPLIGRLDF